MGARRTGAAVVGALLATSCAGARGVDPAFQARVPAVHAEYFGRQGAVDDVRFGAFTVSDISVIHAVTPERSSGQKGVARQIAFTLEGPDDALFWATCSLESRAGLVTPPAWVIRGDMRQLEVFWAKGLCRAYEPDHPEAPSYEVRLTGQDSTELLQASVLGGRIVRRTADTPMGEVATSLGIRGGNGRYAVTTRASDERPAATIAAIDIAGDTTDVRIASDMPAVAKEPSALLLGIVLAIDGVGLNPGPRFVDTGGSFAKRATSLSLSADFGCAVFEGGAVRCWDRDGAYDPAVRGATSVVSGDSFACAARGKDRPVCWRHPGSSPNGAALGDGGLTDWKEPAIVYGPDGVTSLVAAARGDAHACAFASESDLYCWGENARWSDDSKVPLPLRVAEAEGAKKAVLYTADEAECTALAAVFEDGSARVVASSRAPRCRDAMFLMPLSRVTKPLEAVADIAFGSRYALVLHRDGTVKTWGERGASSALSVDGEQAAGDYTPRPVAGLPKIAAIAAADDHACALDVEGGVWCWGGNGSGQVGNGTTDTVKTPARVASGVTAIAAAGKRTCALGKDGGISCWGLGASDRAVTSPARVDLEARRSR